MKIITVRNIDSFVAKIRPNTSTKNKKIVENIISDVQKKGDLAVKKYEKKFGANIKSLRISKQELVYAYSQVSKNELAALKTSKKRLETSEKIVKSKLKNFTINTKGIKISKRFTPIDSVGCYVPGGLAKYPSSVIMSVTPAKVAGVKRILVVTPPNKKGKIDPLTLVAADLCGATEIYKTGGAQSIAALSFGTASIKPVDKIVGPGGSFVTLAKSLVSENSAIDMLAGPTELGIIADAYSNSKYVTTDLISQAEHSKDTFCYLITNSKTKAKEVNQMLKNKIKTVPRKEIVQTSLLKNGFIAICKTKNEMIELANQLAPEHLEILTKNPQTLANKIKTPGLVLVGENTPSSVSDYILGSNHILPTNGFGKTRGSLSVLDFLKLGTKITTTKAELEKVSKQMKILTSSEGLPNHYYALEERL